MEQDLFSFRTNKTDSPSFSPFLTVPSSPISLPTTKYNSVSYKATTASFNPTLIRLVRRTEDSILEFKMSLRESDPRTTVAFEQGWS